MSEEQQEPKSKDVVLGGKTTPQRGAVLGGIEGLKKRLESSNQQERITALQQAVDYGDEGLKLVKEATLEDRHKLAENSNTPVELLQQLALDEIGLVRGKVAKNPNTPVGGLEQLALNRNKDVRKQVAQNPNCSEKLLQQLAQDEDRIVSDEAKCSLQLKQSS